MIRLLGACAAFLACMDSQAKTAGADNGGAGDVATREPIASVAGSGSAASTMRLERVAGSFRSPVYLISPPGDARLFIVEQAGRIRIVKNGSVISQPFLDISDQVSSGGERGLLSMAFQPDYRTNGYFYVNYTDREGDTRIERYKVSSDADVADSRSAKLILGIDQPYANHNGGLVMFGPDRMLYIGMGDGGSGGDPHRNGQNRKVLLAKLLRIDVSRGEPYAIPPGNPYADGSNGRPEIWATGLRNPWRFAFDRPTGLLYIADVGQNEREEIDIVPADRAGVNYGWNIMEADRCYRDSGCNRSGLELPKVSYGHPGGACSITGGFVYRGRRIPAIAGHYFYSDYCAGWLRSFRFENGAAVDNREWNTDDLGHVVSFGEDSAGDLYILTEGGKVYRLAGVS